MRVAAALTAMLGVAVAGGSAFLANDLLDAQQARVTDQSAAGLVNVIVANQDIGFGEVINRMALTTIAWPRDAVPVGVFSKFDDLLPEQGDPARRATRAIAQGEPILLSKVSEFGEKVTIVQTLGPGKRAMAVKVTAETAVGGFVTPGDFVDVVLTQGRNEDLRAVTILQNIRVIGVDQQSDELSDSPEVARTVTVEVTPEQGQRLALAQQAGTLSLTLRTLSEAEDTPLETIRLSDVLRSEPVQTPDTEDAPMPSRVIIIRRGGEVTEQQLRW